MNDVKQTTPLERLIKVASAGFLLYGYHGYSLHACAEAMNLPEKKLYGYVNDKLDLAHQIMQALRVEAREVICANQWPFSLCNGLQLAVLPSKLWVANDKALQLKIRAYYDDWRLAFIDNAFTCSDSSYYDLHPRGNRGFLMWLGFWGMNQMGLSAIEVEVPKKVSIPTAPNIE